MEDDIIEIGNITHYFSKLNVAVVALMLPLSVGDRIQIVGPKTDFEQIVDSIQIEQKEIRRAEGGQNIGLKITQRVQMKDVVFKSFKV